MYKNAIINVHTHGRKNMEPYKQMYYHLFNAVTNALEAMASGKPAEAAALLRQAQCETEELYITADSDVQNGSDL